MKIDPEIMSDADLEQTITAMLAEQSKRADLVRVLADNANLESTYHSASLDREMGDSWTQPLGGFQGYPQGWRVTHGDKLWESLLSGNVWEPEKPTNPAIAGLFYTQK